MRVIIEISEHFTLWGWGSLPARMLRHPSSTRTVKTFHTPNSVPPPKPRPLQQNGEKKGTSIKIPYFQCQTGRAGQARLAGKQPTRNQMETVFRIDLSSLLTVIIMLGGAGGRFCECEVSMCGLWHFPLRKWMQSIYIINQTYHQHFSV